MNALDRFMGYVDRKIKLWHRMCKAIWKVGRKVIEEEIKKDKLSQKELEHYIRREISDRLGDVFEKE